MIDYFLNRFFSTRVLGLRIEERDTDDSWFSKHLGNVCARIVPDLEVVKKLCEPCFPPSFKIFDFCIKIVHEVISDYFKQLLDTNQLRGQEYFVLLSWQDTYKSDYFMGYPSLQIDVTKLPDLLEDAYFVRALDEHIDYTRKRISLWFQNAMDKNVKDWIASTTPYTIEGNFESSMPNDINTMLIQQVMSFFLIFFDLI